MPFHKATLFVGALVVLGVFVVGAALFVHEEQPNGGVTYVLEPVAAETYDSELPSLSYEVAFDDSFPEEARKTVRERIETTTAQLSRHPEDGTAWMDLALWYHTAGDFEAATRVWEFIIDVDPSNVTVLNNLGRLYHYSTPDFAKAESYFERAREVNPNRADSYIELFDLYRYSFKRETTRAVDIMKEASTRFPDDPGFPAALGAYYRDRGQLTLARQQFEEALERARIANDLNVITTLNAELASL